MRCADAAYASRRTEECAWGGRDSASCPCPSWPAARIAGVNGRERFPRRRPAADGGRLRKTLGCLSRLPWPARPPRLLGHSVRPWSSISTLWARFPPPATTAAQRGAAGRRSRSTTSATSRRPVAGSSPRPPTGRSWPRPGTSPGTSAQLRLPARPGQDFDSIHPSLQRQAILNMEYGLFEVVPGHIYQVRGFDLANISFVRSDTGWIVFDPLTAKETAAAALRAGHRAPRRAAGRRRRLLALARRPLRRRARRRRRGRRAPAARSR